MPEEVKITITNTGDVTVAAKGVAGQGCHKLTKAIEEAIGSRVSSTPTAEAYQTPQASQVKQGGK